MKNEESKQAKSLKMQKKDQNHTAHNLSSIRAVPSMTHDQPQCYRYLPMLNP